MLIGLALSLALVGEIPSPAPITPDRAHQIDRIAQGEMHAGSTPGLAIGVVEDGLLVYDRGFGQGINARTKFFTGDVSEQFTAACVLLLAQDRKLALTDRVDHFIPELGMAHDVTIAQLLSHTSGLPALAQIPGVPQQFAKPVRWDDVIKSLAKLKPVAPAGTVYSRNAVDYALAATIVQRVSGLPYSIFMQTRIFEPLIMNSTFLAGDQGASDVVRGYVRRSGRFYPAPRVDASRLFGSSDIISTVDDLAKWDIGMPLLLNVDSMRTMWSAVQAQGSALYGIGWVVDERGGERFVWRNGQMPGYHAMNALLPDRHVAVIVLSNANSSFEATTVSPERIASRVLGLVAPLPPANVANQIVQRASEWLGRMARVDIDRTQLTPAFSKRLTDRVILQTDLRSAGALESIVPVENFERDGDTVYVFDVRFKNGAMRYQFALTPDGKIDDLLLQPAS